MPKESTSIVNGLSQSFVFTSIDIHSISKIVVSMIGCGKNRNMCMDFIIRTFRILRSYYYPSNVGNWMENFFEFLQTLPECYIERLRQLCYLFF
jgi:hypothetical protein